MAGEQRGGEQMELHKSLDQLPNVTATKPKVLASDTDSLWYLWKLEV